MDMLIHVSAMDFQRNLRRYVEESPSPLDGFAPGWREVIDLRERDGLVRQKILGFWLSLIRKLDMQPSQGIELVTGSNNQPLYWLVFVARHPLAGKFWDEIRKVGSQSNMF